VATANILMPKEAMRSKQSCNSGNSRSDESVMAQERPRVKAGVTDRRDGIQGAIPSSALHPCFCWDGSVR
jgi:hypothetical protein